MAPSRSRAGCAPRVRTREGLNLTAEQLTRNAVGRLSCVTLIPGAQLFGLPPARWCSVEAVAIKADETRAEPLHHCLAAYRNERYGDRSSPLPGRARFSLVGLFRSRGRGFMPWRVGGPNQTSSAHTKPAGGRAGSRASLTISVNHSAAARAPPDRRWPNPNDALNTRSPLVTGAAVRTPRAPRQCPRRRGWGFASRP